MRNLRKIIKVFLPQFLGAVLDDLLDLGREQRGVVPRPAVLKVEPVDVADDRRDHQLATLLGRLEPLDEGKCDKKIHDLADISQSPP